MPEVHSLLSPSASHRWMYCPASVMMSKDIPSKSSKYAKEGTAVHKVIELSIKDRVSPLSFRGKTVEGITITPDMAHNASHFVEYFNSHRDENTVAESEMWVDLKFLDITGLDGGTADGVLVTADSITVMDYKNGSGVKVESYMNTQLLCYAVGLVHMFPGRKEVTLVIIQPNVCSEPIEWTLTTAEVMFWCKYVLVPKAKACLDIMAPCCPSTSACRFCPCASSCKAYYQVSTICTKMDFAEEDIQPPAVEYLSIEQKGRIVFYADMIRNFLLAVEASVKDDLMHGSKDYPMLKLVRKATRRRLKEDALDDVTSPLWDILSEDDVFTRKAKPLSELESAIKNVSDRQTAKKIIDSITEKPEGEIVVVSYEDKRNAVEPLTSEFTQIGE